METFFAALISTTLMLTWGVNAKVAPVFQDACTAGSYETAAKLNAASLETAPITPFGRSEAGWRIYAPQVARTIGTPCAPETKGFAATLAGWQAHHRLHATGSVNLETMEAMKVDWQQARPFVQEMHGGTCPDAPADADLANTVPREGWSGKVAKLEPGALAALRTMVAAAREADPRIAADPQMLQIVSAFRSPAYDSERCAKERNCNGLVRARCSAHRTGRAIDLYIGALPGQSPVSSDDENRLFQTRTPAYRWLVANAARFGFVNYVFEPWHWEWTGSPAPITTAVLELPPHGPKAVVASMSTDSKQLPDLSHRLRMWLGLVN